MKLTCLKKHCSIFIFILVLLFLNGCKKNEILETQLIEKNGIKYYDEKVFSGVSIQTLPGEITIKNKRIYENGVISKIESLNVNFDTKIAELSFVNGKSHGIGRSFYDDGTLMIEKVFDEGKLLSEKCWNFEKEKTDCRTIKKNFLPN